MSVDSPEYRLLQEQWQALLQNQITVATLQAFYARYKYLIMSRHIASYQEIGSLLATANKQNLPAVAQRVFELMQHALAIPATQGGNVNALLHISGYLKKQLAPEEKQNLRDVIAQYGRGDVELEKPVALLRLYFERFPNPYIEQQLFFQAT